MISAKIIADSINSRGNRLTSFVVIFPRIVLAEFNTHRALSRNSASSRAIPFERMLKMVEENPFIPIKWMKDHKGMQGNQYFNENDIINVAPCDPQDTGKRYAVEYFKEMWLCARNRATNNAIILSESGLTKQICNRLLEPFMWHTVIVTATEWDNFYALRAHEAAEIHIQALAHEMLNAANASTPKLLQSGEWHIPFGDNISEDRIRESVVEEDERCVHFHEDQWRKVISRYKIEIATARCARVSYMNFEGNDDYAADLRLHSQLLKSGHMSPFEHCAMAPEWSMNSKEESNFQGFIQYRKTLPGENKVDSRLIK